MEFNEPVEVSNLLFNKTLFIETTNNSRCLIQHLFNNSNIIIILFDVMLKY